MNLQTLSHTPPWQWPEDADVTLLGVLEDAHATASDRLLAAELAGEFVVAGDEIAQALLSILGDAAASDPLRAQAAISLGPALESAYEYEGEEDFDDGDVAISQPIYDTIRTSLRLAYEDATLPTEVRRAILEASVRAPQQWHQQAVTAAYRSDDPDWKRTAVFCMRYVRGFDAQIVEALSSGRADILEQAVEAAGAWGVPGAWRRVAAIVKAPPPDKLLLLAAIAAVGSIRPRQAHDVLGHLMSSTDQDIVDAVHEVLTMAEDTSDDGEDALD